MVFPRVKSLVKEMSQDCKGFFNKNLKSLSQDFQFSNFLLGYITINNKLNLHKSRAYANLFMRTLKRRKKELENILL